MRSFIDAQIVQVLNVTKRMDPRKKTIQYVKIKTVKVCLYWKDTFPSLTARDTIF